MSWGWVLGISIALAMDAFAVAIAAGLIVRPATFRHTFRLAFHFGLFQFLMPILGWSAGAQVADRIRDYDHWIAFGLLALIGGKMLREACSSDKSPVMDDPTRGLTLVTLSVATSIDALAVGLSFALIDASIWLTAVVIGLAAATLTTIGFQLGTRLGTSWSRGADAIGGTILLVIGVQILISHLLE